MSSALAIILIAGMLVGTYVPVKETEWHRDNALQATGVTQ